jgi:ubiquitin-protein ligase
MSVSGEWIDVSQVAEVSVSDFLVSKGLGSYAEKIMEVTDAESLEDLKMIDASMVEDVIRDAQLKIISAKKLRIALAQLRGDVVSPDASPKADSPKLASSGYAQVEAAVSPAAQVAPQLQVQEVIAVCIDRSGSMGTPFAETTLNVVQGETKSSVAQRTRMEAVKVMFYAFRDRVESLGQGSHQIGLIQFDNKVEELLDATRELARFEAIVDDREKRGQTAIYSAVSQAASMLEKHFDADSQTDLRVLVLTDGQSNSGILPTEALAAVNRIGAVVDAIIVGDRPDADLRRIVNATGGECYQISNLGEGFELLEAEGVVSLRARRGGAEKPPFEKRKMVDFGSISEKSMISGVAVQRAPTLAPDLANKAVVNVASIADGAVSVSGGCGGGGASMKRVLAELKQVASGAVGVWMHSGEGIHVFPAPDNLNFWRVLMEGPQGSPFEGGVFALSVIIPDNYPFQAPRVTFETPVYHCNVSDSGKICLDILLDRWSPSLSVPKCLEAIRILLKEPDTDMSLRQWIAELTLAHQKSNGGDTRYVDKVRESVLRDASLSVADWKLKWGC